MKMTTMSKKRKLLNTYQQGGSTYGTGIEEKVLLLWKKLHYECRKQLHRQAKICKSLECQKLVRHLKQYHHHHHHQNEASNDNNGGNDTKSPATSLAAVSSVHDDDDKVVPKQERKLRRLKSMSIDNIVDVALRRIGMPIMADNMNTADNAGADEDDDEDNGHHQHQDDSTVAPTVGSMDNTKVPSSATVLLSPQQSNEVVNEWIEVILQQKRMRECMETWGEKITIHQRQWHQYQQRKKQGNSNISTIRSRNTNMNDNNSNNSTKKDIHSRDNDVQNVTFGKSQFVHLGDNDDDDHNHHANDNDNKKDIHPSIKANRPGQRARKAKAMAIESRKLGTPVAQSLNWRNKKATAPVSLPVQNNTSTHYSSNQSTSKNICSSSHNNVTTQTSDQLHPSWQARKTQTVGIVAFQGTKVTFDDD
jgi:hypothetical protein